MSDVLGFDPAWAHRRIGGLRRFAIAITALNALGHAWLGFEPSWAQPCVALATAYALELAIEALDARAARRCARFRGRGGAGFVDFLLPAHISGLAVAMLLYPGERLWPIAFAASVAIGSKRVLRVPSGAGRTMHFMNPSNAGITATLLAFPSVGVAAPYQFTENLEGALDWLLPALIVVSGSFINARFTGRLPLVAGWLVGFVAQACGRHLWLDAPLLPALAPMTGLAFVLFTFYMVTDPATTPNGVRSQVAFGVATALAYGAITAAHGVFGMFLALTAVCTLRGIGLLVRGTFARAGGR